jgi:putative membrane protein
MLRLTLAWLHLIALGVGLWAVLARGRALREAVRELPGVGALRRAFLADSQWGVAAGLWIGTGLWRYLGGTEKTTAYYNANHIFITKMALLAVILVLEVWPMITLIRWRVAIGGRGPGEAGDAPGAGVNASAARRIAAISYVQGIIVVVMVFTAVAMARGYGARS